MYASATLEMCMIEVQELVALGMSLGHCYMILTFQIYISKNAAVKGYLGLFFALIGATGRVIQGPLGWIRKSYEEGWI